MSKKERLALKKKLLDHCLRIQLANADNLRSVIADTEDSLGPHGQPVDGFDAYRSVQMNRREMFAQQLDKALKELQLLKRIKSDEIQDKVEFGAVVQTREQDLFIAIGLGRVTLGDDCYFVISPQVPYFQAMQGLGKDQSFEFRGKEHYIQDVF